MNKIIKSTQKGFTLVELLVVIAIIGILAAIAVPRFASATNSAKIATFESDHGILKSAITMYMGNNSGNFPDDLKTDLVPYLTTDKIALIAGNVLTDNVTDTTNAITHTWDETTGTLTSNYAVVGEQKYVDGDMIYSFIDGNQSVFTNN